MRLRIDMETYKGLVLPIHYNHHIQGFIYNNLYKELREKLHKKGFSYGNRNFKLFTFSRIYGDFQLVEKHIVFFNKIHFFVSSPYIEFLSQLGESLLKKKKFILGKNIVTTIGINLLPRINFGEHVRIKMMTPLTVYSTVLTMDKKKKTYFYSPKEKEFPILVENNLRNKFQAFKGYEIPDFIFKIKPIKVSTNSQKIITYKNFIIKGWMGIYDILSTPEFIEFAYDAGLGSKNSQGFGMFDVSNQTTIEQKNKGEFLPVNYNP